MTILASRDQTCVHPRVSRMVNKNEECKQLLEHRRQQDTGQFSCPYYENVQRTITSRFRHQSWDLEDLITQGKRMRGCPYYASRELVPGADIVFCPYNYLIDPIIRSSMDISLHNAIIILDEAHNIEVSQLHPFLHVQLLTREHDS